MGVAAFSVTVAAIVMLNHGCQSPSRQSTAVPPVTITPGTPNSAATSDPTGPTAASGPSLPSLPGITPRPAPKVAPIQPLVPRPGVGTGAVTVLTQPAVKTFVYFNGGSLLGETPLRNAAVPAGDHTLVFWSPEVGGRSKRAIKVVAGESQTVIENMDGKHSFAEPKETTEQARVDSEKPSTN